MTARLVLLLAAAWPVAYAQADSGTIAIAASRNVTLPPDQVVYQIDVQIGLDATLSDVVALLAETGITEADLRYANGDLSKIHWGLQLTAPLSKSKETQAALARVAKAVGTMSFSVSFAQVSEAARAQACDFSALVCDARREADRLASAAGVKAGEIVGLSDGSGGPTLAVRAGAFAGILDPAGSFSSFLLGGPYSAAPPVSCSILVVFRLVG